MADNGNGFVSGHYLGRSWALLTHDRGWIKPVLVLALATLIPVVGPLGLLGYALEWARLTAWGVDSAPKQKGVDVGEVLLSGLRGLVVGLVWEAALLAVFLLLQGALGLVRAGWADTLSSALDVVYVLSCLVLCPVVVAAEVRGAVYCRIAPGLRADRVLEMARRDLGGLMHVLAVVGLCALAALVLSLLLVLSVVAAVVPAAVSVGLGEAMGSSLPGTLALTWAVRNMLLPLGPILVVFWYLFALVRVVGTLLVTTGVALWMRQFDVPAWGRSGDRLPEDRRG